MSKLTSAHALMAGFSPPSHCCPRIWQDETSAVLSKQQITSYFPGQIKRGRDFSGRTLQAAVCKCQQLEAKAYYLKNRGKGSSRSTCEDQDEVTDKSKQIFSNIVNFYSSWGLGFWKPSV